MPNFFSWKADPSYWYVLGLVVSFYLGFVVGSLTKTL